MNTAFKNITSIENNVPLPDIELGVNTKSGEMVVLKGKDRTLNNLIIGSIGTAKTSALVLPMINQDLHYEGGVNSYCNVCEKELGKSETDDNGRAMCLECYSKR